MIFDYLSAGQLDLLIKEQQFEVSKYLHPMEKEDTFYTRPEVLERYKLLAALSNIHKPGKIAEIGTRRGYTAAALLNSGVTKFYFGVDINQPNGWGGVSGGLAYTHHMLATTDLKVKLPRFLLTEANTFHSQHWLRPLVTTEGYFDLVLVNADPSYPCVVCDLNSAWQMLAAGGLIFVLDTDTPSVKEAVVDFCAKSGAAAKTIPCWMGLKILSQEQTIVTSSRGYGDIFGITSLASTPVRVTKKYTVEAQPIMPDEDV